MKKLRIAAFSAATFLLGAMATVPASAADAYPAKAIQFIIPGPPGGSTDILGRLLSEKLSQSLGQPVTPMNRPGANGVVAASALLNAPADGYTISLSVDPHRLINPLVSSKPPYDSVKDFAPIATVSVSPLLLAVGETVPANTLQEFVDYAKANPGKVNYGSSGIGSADHLFLELLSKKLGIEMNHIPYQGAAPLMVDLIGGRIQMRVGTILTNMSFIQNNQLKPLALDDEARSPLLPDVPTFAEAGMEPLNMKVAFGVVAKAGTPKPIIDKLSSTINEILAMPDVIETIRKNGGEPVTSTPEEFGAAIERDVKLYTDIIKTANIPIQ